MRPFPCGLSYLQTVGTSAFFQHATIFPRLAINLIYFRSRVTFCCTVFQSLSHVVVLFGLGAFCQHCQLHWVVFTTTEVFTAVFLTAGNAVWERFVHGQIRADIETAATQSEAMASRRLLNTMCDATFELDDKLCITGEAAQLAGMLHLGIHRCLRGTQVESFVLQVDRELFRSRITAPVPENQEMANVFRISLFDSLNNAIKVEVYHVPVHIPFAATRHLVGVKELVDFGDTVDYELSTAPSSQWSSHVSSRHSKRSRRSRSRRGSTQTPLPGTSNAGSGTDPRSGCSQLFVVKFYADSMDVLDATGPGAEACVQGSCFRSMLQPGQDFFMDLQMGCGALRYMLLSDPHAQFHFRSCVEFQQGAIPEALCVVTLAVEDPGRIGVGCTDLLPIVATLQVVGSMPMTPPSSHTSDCGIESDAASAHSDSSS